MEMRKHKFPYNWMLSEAKMTKIKLNWAYIKDLIPNTED